jgi:23S rRNA (cytosine1962-C5)-methyltransferase
MTASEPDTTLPDCLAAALSARTPLLAEDPQHTGGWRLFNGFTEGWPELTVEVYARTLVLHNHARPAEIGQPAAALAQALCLERLPWLGGVISKARHGASADERRGRRLWGVADTRLREAGVRYALDLGLNQDTSFYLDTRGLRDWARQTLAGQTVLNAFAYTGSLGVAALAGGAARVVQLDRSRAFLNLAKASYALNGYPIRRGDFVAADFFGAAARLRRAGARFDCVFLDPPFFSATAGGRVDLLAESGRLINKARPLVADGGRLVAVNNALFLSGAEYLRVLQALCADGYLELEGLIPVPADCTGFPGTVVRALPADPAPFNHATKIAVLRVRRKAG